MEKTKALVTVRGTLQGKTIVLEEGLNLPDGLTLILDVFLQPGDGIRLSAGAWADAGPDLEETLQDLRRWRGKGRDGQKPRDF